MPPPKNLASATITATGAIVSRSFGDRFSDVKNVKDYGVRGDGLGSDTVAIQAALDAAHSKGGGIVFVPAGVYNLTSTLTVAAGVTLQGENQGASILQVTGASSFDVVRVIGYGGSVEI